MEYVSKRKPRAKQAEALELMRGKKAFALLMGMRCVDGATEYLSPRGWKKISDYEGGEVAEFRLDGTAHFVTPISYIKSKVDHFWHFHTQGGVDQVLSDHHRILICSRRDNKFGKIVGTVPDKFRNFPLPETDHWRETSPLELIAFKRRFKDHVPTSFWLTNSSRIDLTDDEIRLMVAFHADGSIGYKGSGVINVKRERKKDRLRRLLSRMTLQWKETKYSNKFSRFVFRPPHVTKTYGDVWWDASYEQRLVIIDEICHWDGFVDGETRYYRGNGTRVYSSVHRFDVDFIQYCFASTGHRTSMLSWKGRVRKYKGKMRRYRGGSQVTISGYGRTNNLALLPRPIRYRGKNDGYMYSFSVPSTYLVLRRNGKVFVTGNTGKTKPICDEYGESVVNGDTLDILVAAPAGAYLTWAAEIPKDIPDEIMTNVMVYIWVSGKTSSKRGKRELEAFVTYRGPRVLLMNMEAVSMVDEARSLCKSFLEQRPEFNAMVIDESVVIKNPEAKCSLYCVNTLAPLAKRRRILSGLVSPRSPLDVYPQFKFLDKEILGFDYFTTFKARYAKTSRICMLPNEAVRSMFLKYLEASEIRCMTMEQMNRKLVAVFPTLNTKEMSRREMLEALETAADAAPRDVMIDSIGRLGGYIQTVEVIQKYENVEEIHAKIAPYSFRVRLEDCYDMPPSDYSFRDVELTKEQLRIYDDIKKFATAQLTLQDHVTADNVITQMLRLHQVLCGHTKDEQGGIHLIPENRTKALIELLQDYEGKAVIWCSYDLDVRKVFNALEEEFGPGSTSRFWGGNIKSREDEEAFFKRDVRRRFMVATPDAGRFSRNWSVANLVIYYSSKNNLDHRDQSEMRVKDEGKMTPIAYVDLRAPGTVDEKIIAALRAKIDMAAVINGDNWREWLI